MKQPKTKSRKKPLDYPEETEGSRLAVEIRRRTNRLTMEERRQLFQEARATPSRKIVHMHDFSGIEWLDLISARLRGIRNSEVLDSRLEA